MSKKDEQQTAIPVVLRVRNVDPDKRAHHLYPGKVLAPGQVEEVPAKYQALVQRALPRAIGPRGPYLEITTDAPKSAEEAVRELEEKEAARDKRLQRGRPK